MSFKRVGDSTINFVPCEFPNLYRFRLSPELATIETAGVCSSCPGRIHNVIYPRTIGLVPHYGGHVPGEAFRVGQTFGESTRDAKRWLALNKD